MGLASSSGFAAGKLYCSFCFDCWLNSWVRSSDRCCYLLLSRLFLVKMNSLFKSSLFWCSDMLDQSAFQVFLTESNLSKSDNFSITMIPSVLSSRCSHETNNFLYALIHSTHVKSAVNWNVHRVFISIFDSMMWNKGSWKMHLRD